MGGSAEVLTETLQKLSNDKVKLRVIHAGVGAVSESDVLLASASNAIIIGFNVRPELHHQRPASHSTTVSAPTGELYVVHSTCMRISPEARTLYQR